VFQDGRIDATYLSFIWLEVDVEKSKDGRKPSREEVRFKNPIDSEVAGHHPYNTPRL